MTRLIAVVSLAGAIAACGTSATPSGATSGSSPMQTPGLGSAAPTSSIGPSGPATTEPSPDPTEASHATRPQWAQDPPRPILTGAAAEVVVDKLNVRQRPETSAKIVGAVSRGRVLLTGGPPVESGEYIWYWAVVTWESVADIPALPTPFFAVGAQLAGWVAASTGATDYLRPIEARCPDVANLRNVGAMLPSERVACLGDRSLELTGSIGCVPCSPEIFGDYAPEWLLNPNRVDDLLWERFMKGGNVMLRFPPGGPERPDAGAIVRVRGHFRDDAANQCSIGLAYPWGDAFKFHPVGSAVARQLCRQEFVVETYELLGEDPLFDG